ncbi:hypothetical protein [uncultured Draconibacterium sp.]|uniref:hypothetical protein n=1 Tax=uncultured Draconibacterium sp. TaxID=1573823 RepID=UPI003217093F
MKWIDAYDLDKIWAGRRDCQETLPLLIRKLIRATTNSIQSIKFPSGESVLFGGWDGILEVTEETEYFPSGTSLWEFGANKDPKTKADSDYAKRTSNPLGYKPSESTFIFVTPRLWQNGEEWANKKKEEGNWKDIKVINSEILEEWIEIAPVVGAWLSMNIGTFPKGGLQPTDDFWEQWSAGAKFQLNSDILLGGREKEQEIIIKRIKQPAIIPVQGISREESLAFIISCFQNNYESEEDFFSRSIIIDNVEVFRELSVLNKPLILIPRFEDGGVINRAVQRGHTILVPLGADSSGSWGDKIILPQIERDSFVAALVKTGMTKEFAERYSKESTRNITILRRQLEFERTAPVWSLPENVSDIVPALIVGRWDENYENDKRIIAQIADDSYENYSKKITRWLHSDDSPIVKIGSTWRLTSPFDTWTYASKYLTRNEFESLYKSTIEILTELNPALELEPEERHLASIYGKKREFSSWIREGVVQSLILTSIFGDKLKFDLPIKAELWVDGIVTELLNSNSSVMWKSLDRLLPLIAEASPSSFLSSVEKYLSQDNSPIISLFEEDPGFLASHSYHTGLLWALESLAWFPNYLSRSSLILSKLAAVDPGGNLSNRPINSIAEIFKPWHYQTLASFNERIQVLKLISKKEPDIAWLILTRMLPNSTRDTASPTHQVRWRMFDYETEVIASYNEVYETHSCVIDILLSIFDYTEVKLATLIKESVTLSIDDRNKVLDFVENAIPGLNHDENLAWHSVREILNHNRSHPNTNWALPENLLSPYVKIHETLTPEDTVEKHIWMFNDYYPQFPEGYNYDKITDEEHEKNILDKRIRAVGDIIQEYGLGKIIELSSLVKEPDTLGDSLGYVINEEEEIIVLCKQLANVGENLRFLQSFIFRKSILNGYDWILNLFHKLEKLEFKNQSLANLLVSLNPTKVLWDFIESTNSEIKSVFWKSVFPNFNRMSPEEKEFGFERLIEHKRYNSAVNLSARYVKELSSNLILSILEHAGKEKSEEQVRLDGYRINRLFEELDKRVDIDSNMFIQLEWLYLPILASYGNRRKPKKLHGELSQNPEFFIDVLKWTYRPDDESIVEELKGGLTDEQKLNRALQASDLLNSWASIPGMTENGEIDSGFLSGWAEKVRELAKINGRLEVADMHIGKILAQYPEEPVKVWPPDIICEIIETVNTDSIKSNFSTAVFNKRSFSSRSPFAGGEIERNKADYFKGLATAHQNKFPVVTGIFEKLAKGYEEDAKRMDEHAERNKLDY